MMYVELEVHHLVGALKGIPVQATRMVRPYVWPENAIVNFTDFVRMHPPTVTFSDVRMAVKGDMTKVAAVPDEWKGQCPIRYIQSEHCDEKK